MKIMDAGKDLCFENVHRCCMSLLYQNYAVTGIKKMSR